MNVLSHVRKLLRSGGIRAPAWYKPLTRVPPLQLLEPRTHEKPRDIVYPEDRLMRRFGRQFPSLKLQPVDLHSSQPGGGSILWQLVERQKALVKEQGMHEEKAYREVVKQFQEETRMLLLEKKLLAKQAEDMGLDTRPSYQDRRIIDYSMAFNNLQDKLFRMGVTSAPSPDSALGGMEDMADQATNSSAVDEEDNVQLDFRTGKHSALYRKPTPPHSQKSGSEQ